MARALVLVVLASILGHLEAAPIPKSGPKPPWRFPTQAGTKWVYANSGGGEAEVTETITKVEKMGEATLIRLRYTRDEAKKQVIDVITLWLDDEGLFQALGRLKPEPEFLLLKFPYRVGDVWEQRHADLAISRTASRIVAEEKVKVPAGTFDCVRVETNGYEGDELAWVRTDWYASGVGLVKSTGYPTEKCARVLKQFTLGKD